MRAFLLISLLVACGGSETTEQPEPETTSGDESTAPPVVLRTTTPVPVPSPAVAREELSPTLQQLWQDVEEVVAMRPPEPPAEGTMEAVTQWANGPFRTWIASRTAKAQEVRTLADELEASEETPPWEHVVGAALFGYMYEDTAAGARGAPVPNDIAGDEELLQVYTDALTQAVQPVGRAAFQAYVFCAERAARDLAETPWAEWGPYCYQRAGEVNEVFELTPAQASESDATEMSTDAPADPPDEAEGEGPPVSALHAPPRG